MNYPRARGAGRESAIALDPVALDHGAAGRHGLLLKLGGENVGPKLASILLEHSPWLAQWPEDLARLADVEAPSGEADSLGGLRNGRQLQDGPIVRGIEDEAGEVIDMDALHHDHNLTCALIVQPAEEGVEIPVVHALPQRLGQSHRPA